MYRFAVFCILMMTMGAAVHAANDVHIKLYKKAGNKGYLCTIVVSNVTSLTSYDRRYNLKKLRKCKNDEARSLSVSGPAPAGTQILVYDDPNGGRHDDWFEMRFVRNMTGAGLYGAQTFEANWSDNFVKATYHRKNGLNGKVSHLQIVIPPNASSNTRPDSPVKTGGAVGGSAVLKVFGK